MLSMRTIVLFAIVAMAVARRGPPHGGHGGPPHGGHGGPPHGGHGGPPPDGGPPPSCPSEYILPEEEACKEALKADVTKKELITIFQDCVAEQDGLQAIVDGFGIPKGKINANLKALEEVDSAAALAVRKCQAGKLEEVADPTADFDVDAFKAIVLERLDISDLAGPESTANVQAGLDDCDTAPLIDFKVAEYMKCIVAFCATGVAPPTE